MTDITNLDDLNLDNSKTLKSEGFGNMSLNKLLKDNEMTPSSQGLGSLLGSKEKIPKVNDSDLQLYFSQIFNRFNELEKKIDSSPKKTDHFKLPFFFSLILICILGVMNINSDQKVISDQKTSKVSQKNKLPVMITNKFVNLRKLPSSKSKMLMTLAPQMILKVINTRGGWSNIEYKDLLTSKTTRGWLWSEYIQKSK